MIKRFVKMKFKPENIERFKDIFNTSKPLIEAMDGCNHVELLQDINNPSVFFTLSIWESQSNLDNYRNSELFKGVWAKTKILFDAKPEAWSVQLV
jgi:heme-degrading monooxygenase HmoA